MKKKDRDIIAAFIFSLIWEIFFISGFIVEDVTGSKAGWCVFLIDTAIQITILVYDAKIERLEKQLKKTRKNLSQQTAAYVEYVRKHGAEPETVIEQTEAKRAVIISLNKYFHRYRKRRGA